MATSKSKVVAFRSPVYRADIERKNDVIALRIEEARQKKGLSQKEFRLLLSKHGVEVGQSGVSKWMMRGGNVPNAYQLLAICHALDIEDGLSYFTEDYSPELNDEGLRKVESYRADLIASGRYKPQPKSALIQYVDMRISNLSVSAGIGEFLDEGNFETVSFPKNSVPAGADFGIRVSGNSMEPAYHDGQIVWVQECEVVTPGQVGVFVYDGAGYLKVYGEQTPDEHDAEFFVDSYNQMHMQPVLISYNPDYEDKVVRPGTAFKVVGRVL